MDLEILLHTEIENGTSHIVGLAARAASPAYCKAQANPRDRIKPMSILKGQCYALAGTRFKSDKRFRRRPPTYKLTKLQTHILYLFII
jgi:hypothetical protein